MDRYKNKYKKTPAKLQKKIEIGAIIREEERHIPRSKNRLQQGILREIYSALRMHDLWSKNPRGKAECMREALAKVKEQYRNEPIEFDEDFFFRS